MHRIRPYSDKNTLSAFSSFNFQDEFMNIGEKTIDYIA